MVKAKVVLLKCQGRGQISFGVVIVIHTVMEL